LVLDRPVTWLQARGFRRSLAMIVVLGTAVGVVTLLLFLIAPPVAGDVRQLWQQLSVSIAEGATWLRHRQPGLYDRVLTWAKAQQEGLNSGSSDGRGALAQGVGVVSGVVNVVIVLITAVYILADQGRSLDGVVGRLSPSRQEKIRCTKTAVSQVVYATS